MSLAPAKPVTQSIAHLFPSLGMPEAVSKAVVRDITLDSRKVTQGSLFLAAKGHKVNREVFVGSALAAGALAVVVEGEQESWRYADEKKCALILSVKDLKARIGLIASTFFGEPSKKLKLVGITGTNGKTSCADYLFQLWRHMGFNSASLGTLGWRHLDGDYSPTGLTTLDAVENQRMMSRFVESGVTHVVMEVSSHGIDQGRINALDFDVGALTNITHDHLDYHGSFEHYAQTKERFVRDMAKMMVVNRDDVRGGALTELKNRNTALYDCAIHAEAAAVHAKDIATSASGFNFQLVVQGHTFPAQLNLIGEFNLSNILLVVAVQTALGYHAENYVSLLSKIIAAKGRLECVDNVYVDYAHTPDALKNVLTALKAHCQKRLILVFGCGGDRDKAKRPMMAGIAERQADFIIVTADNPRFESQDAITQDILAGFSPACRYEVISDRAAAIRKAVSISIQGDIVLVAGKGHEDYQETCGKRVPFSDIEEVRKAVA